MRRFLPAAGLAALVIAVGAASYLKRARPVEPQGLLPYQRRVLPAEVERMTQVRAAMRVAEQARSEQKRWPAGFSAPGLTWTQRGQGLYVNYLGVPPDPKGARWLVLYVEPEPAPIRDPAPPEDDEHHTLADGTALHVTVWTQPNDGPLPLDVLPFPAAEGWLQLLR